MTQSILLTSAFRYKAWANQELFATLREVDEAAHSQERHACVRLLNHIYVVDQIFAAHLCRTTHTFVATNTSETPTLDALESGVARTDSWYLDFVSKLDNEALEEPIEFVFTDQTNARMSREEMLMHVNLHGAYHRGAVGRILSQTGLAPPRDLFTGFLHKSEPERRLRT